MVVNTGDPSEAPIGVLVVEDHTMVAEMIASTLARESDIVVKGSVRTAAEAATAVDADHIDVVLMDYRLPDGDGISAARAIRATHPRTRVVIVTGEDSDHLLTDALKAGCAGYLNKSEGVAMLATAVRGAHAGATAVSPDMLAQVMTSAEQARSRAGPDGLSERELEVLRLLAEGLPNGGIADRLFISVNTVRNHTQNILDKLGAHSKLEAVTTAIRAGLVDAPR
jgi:DNA-binding NarL/FixJ family response regulator